MNIMGYNIGYARPGYGDDPGRHPLNDGSAAWLSDGQLLFAGIEERYSRNRYDGGIDWLVGRLLDVYPDLQAPDVIAVSSCCGPMYSKEDAKRQVHSDVFMAWPHWSQKSVQVLVVDHHESHVMSAFVPSGFSRSLVVVYDGMGNLLSGNDWDTGLWWKGNFQRHSYYLAEWRDDKVHLELLEREASGPDDVSLGEAYRAFTHLGGWESYQQAGTAMALAAYAESSSSENPDIIGIADGQIRVNMPNRHSEPSEMVKSLIMAAGIDCRIRTGHKAAPHNKSYCNLVACLQNQLEQSVVQRVAELADKHDLDHVVMCGGVALNCLAMGRLANSFNGEVYVPPAPGDTGQGLGNALWAAYSDKSPLAGTMPRFCAPEAPFWGIEISSTEVANVIDVARNNSRLNVITHENEHKQAEYVAKALADGKIIATALGRSEYGPRALGARSILANPCVEGMAGKVNTFKRREAFRPYAPMVLEERAGEFFSLSGKSPYMSFACKVRDEKVRRIPAVVHKDGSARIQTVESGPARLILEEFGKLTGVAVLLNTSFNRKGQPIVETPQDAIETFLDGNIDMLVLDGFSIEK